MIALAGNPNAGKTTLFNELTGSRQHVGNYPGITVEKKEGKYVGKNYSLHIVDLPGTYSITAYSQEEIVARDFLVNEKPKAVINIIDASNLERNLYLTVQLLELGIPVCCALNMMDIAKSRGIEINTNKLFALLNIPIVETVAREGKGKKELADAVYKLVSEQKERSGLKISYGEDIDNALIEIEQIVTSKNLLTDTYPARWIALKYLEHDEQVIDAGDASNLSASSDIKKIVEKVSLHLKKTVDTYPEAVIADHRYGYINSVVKQGVIKKNGSLDKLYLSDKIDKFFTNRFLGPLLMIGVLTALYKFTFSFSELPVEWFQRFFGIVGSAVDSVMDDGLLKSLIISGIIDGVGGVISFVPLIMLMFLGISLIEDSGYLARVAFMADRIFRMFGLHGSSALAFILSGGIAGGCAVPGVMASRALKSRRERLATILTVPFMSCGAKLPVFSLLAVTFFNKYQTNVMVAITLISWLGALITAKFLRSSIIRGDATPFVMELPPYRFPTFRGLAIHTWERTWQYIKKAGTVILAISILLWALMTFPRLSDAEKAVFEQKRTAVFASEEINTESARQKTEEINYEEASLGLKKSIAGRIGIAIETVTRAAGFDWKMNIALVGGFAAKEVIISTLGTAYSLGEVELDEHKSLSDTLSRSKNWSPLVAAAFIIFTIFYAPCFVTVVCIVKETGSWKWGAFSMIFNTILAFTLATAVFQIGSFMGY